MKTKHSADLQGFKFARTLGCLASGTRVMCQPTPYRLYPKEEARLTSAHAVASKMGFQKAHEFGP